MTQPEPVGPAVPNARPSRRDAAEKIASLLAREEALGTGARAELRRLDPRGALAQPALHRLLARYVPELPIGNDDVMRAWGLVVHALALAAPDNLSGAEQLGRALQAAGWKEGRLVNLLDADLAGLPDHLPRAVRFLVTKGQRLKARDVAELVFSRLDDDEGQADRARRRIASDYYRAEMRAERGAEAPPA